MCKNWMMILHREAAGVDQLARGELGQSGWWELLWLAADCKCGAGALVPIKAGRHWQEQKPCRSRLPPPPQQQGWAHWYRQLAAVPSDAAAATPELQPGLLWPKVPVQQPSELCPDRQAQPWRRRHHRRPC
jgi:hypothetical protein